MKRLGQRSASLLLVLLALTAGWRGAIAQGGVGVKLESVDPSQLPEMSVRVTVVDENGLPILGLTVDNFDLTEDGRTSVKPIRVQSVTHDEAALSVLVLLDLSVTMKGEPLEAAKDATVRLLEKLLNRPADPDRAAFLGFGRDVDIKSLALAEDAREVPFTNDKGRLLNVVNFVEIDTSTGTPLYDALYRAIKIMSGQAGRRAIIVMTDGADVGSILEDNDPIDEARRQHIPLFPVGLSSSRLDVPYLERLAELTGGQYQEAPSPSDVARKFEEILSDLKLQYVLTYPSQWSQLDAQTHSVLVRVNTTRGQGFDEMKVQLVDSTATPQPVWATPGTATISPATPTAQTASTSAVSLAATPTTEDETVDNLGTWISDNMLLAAGIGMAAFLFLMLIVLAFVLMRRRSTPPALGMESIAPPAWSPPEVAPGPPQGPGPAPDFTAGAWPEISAPGGSTQAGTGSRPSPDSGTWVAPTDEPIAPPSFGFQPAPARERETADESGTVVLRRGPRPRVVALLIDRNQPTHRFDLDGPNVSIGRAAGNAIAIDDPTVSRQHAVIRLEGDDFRVYDLGSANGTFVGEARVRDPLTLQDGCIVRFGEVEFIFKRVSLE